MSNEWKEFRALQEVAAAQAAAQNVAGRYQWLADRIKHSVPMVRIQIMHCGQYVLMESKEKLTLTIDRARDAEMINQLVEHRNPSVVKPEHPKRRRSDT